MKRTIDECFFQIQNGANIKQGQIDGGFPITRIETIANNKFNRDRMGYAGITDVSKYKSYILEDGDLLMSHINSAPYLGRTVLYEKRNDETIIHGMNLLRLKARRNIILPSFARYCFFGRIFKSQISTITKKSVNQASFAVKDLKQIKIDVPPIAEQDRIVLRLDTISNVIECENIQLAKLEKLVKSRFIELYNSTVLSQEATIDEIVKSIKVGFVGKCEQYYTDANGIPMLRTGNITSKGLDLSNLKYVTKEFHEKNKKSQIHTGDILIARHGTNGQANVYHGSEAQCLNAVVIVPDVNKVTSVFLAGLINSCFVRNQIERTLVGSTQRVINTKSIAKLVVRIPSLSVQKRYEDFVEQTEKSKLVLRRLLEKQELLRAALMQEYFG